MRRVQAILPLLCQIYAENDQNVVYNEGVQVSEIIVPDFIKFHKISIRLVENYSGILSR